MIRRLFRLQRCLVVLILSLALVPFAASAQGNSQAAHACQGDGYLSLVGVGGETFANVGQCVRFAAQGGQFADGTDVLEGTIVIPKDFSFTLSNQVLAACNALSYGYSLNGGAIQMLGSKAATGCVGGDTFYFDPVTIGPMAEDSVLVLHLTDQTCGASYDSDGDHARVVVSAPVYDVDIADGGPGCTIVNSPWPHGVLGYEGNLSLTVTVHP
jgi:hypothetical protein